MINIKIKSENPFQINGDSFAVSPSAEGYTLNYSADGKQYTAWTEATPAQDTLVVSGCASGMYFKLVGNKSDIVITY